MHRNRKNAESYEKKPKEEVSASRANENRKRLKARLSRRLEELKTDKIPISCKFFDKAIKPHKNLSPNYYQDNYPKRGELAQPEESSQY